MAFNRKSLTINNDLKKKILTSKNIIRADGYQTLYRRLFDSLSKWWTVSTRPVGSC